MDSALKAKPKLENRLNLSSGLSSELNNAHRAQTSTGYFRKQTISSNNSSNKETNSEEDFPKRSQTAPARSQRRKEIEPLSVQFRKALEVPYAFHFYFDQSSAHTLEPMSKMLLFWKV